MGCSKFDFFVKLLVVLGNIELDDSMHRWNERGLCSGFEFLESTFRGIYYTLFFGGKVFGQEVSKVRQKLYQSGMNSGYLK